MPDWMVKFWGCSKEFQLLLWGFWKEGCAPSGSHTKGCSQLWEVGVSVTKQPFFQGNFSESPV